MVDAEEGRYADALACMEKAQKKVGETPEILCHCAIIYYYFDKVKYVEYHDKMALKNLQYMIYENPDVPDGLK